MSSCSPPASRSSMQSVASRTSRSAARPAVTHARTLPAVPVSISPLFAQLAAAKLVSPLSRSLIARFTAATASPRCVLSRTNPRNLTKKHPFFERMLLCVVQCRAEKAKDLRQHRTIQGTRLACGYFRHSSQKSSEIRQGFPAVFASIDENPDGAIRAPLLCGIAFKSFKWRLHLPLNGVQ